ncbi:MULTISPECIES: endolytic transglycosylase MltG [Asaia]|uniref:Endolytic murein transglycosylase n=1 Tax=Asaia bogorensis TaxID=91915 RepID=A0A060QGS5_9PROT|nr:MULTISPECIES: endolytic transglycosylase MltG [Asaia]ETC99079.1 hypothetical protein P792_05440 [Asaia sp. SF2.1]CDG39883.1 protein YceG like [Asaia bogorensis]
MKRVILALVLLLLLCPAGGAALIWHQVTQPGPLQAATDHVVPRGATAHITHDLAQAGIISPGTLSELSFRLAARATASHGALHAAELHFPAQASMLDVLYVLRHGQPVRHFLTIPEGRTARQIAIILQQAPFLTGDVPPLREGAILPQTVAYERDTSRARLVSRLETLMSETLARVWAGRDPSIGLTSPEQLLILASIVERETGIAAERPKVARVFLNRLAQGMKLQSDPTAIYDLSEGLGTLDHGLTHDELHQAGPHNTYVIDGLPPGPICSPGLAALDAVAHPASGDMLYFVADGTGGHGFSHDLHEHNQRVETLKALRGTIKAASPQAAPARHDGRGAGAPSQHRH